MAFFNIFIKSAKEFKNLKSLVLAALLLALHTVLACFVSIQVTDTLRISVSFLTNCVTGFLFGPVMGFVCGGLGDIIQFVIRPMGPYFFGWTLNAALAGFIYGCFFYGRSPKTMPVFRLKTDASDKATKDSKEALGEASEEGGAKKKRKLHLYDFGSIIIAAIQIAVVLSVSVIKYLGDSYSGFEILVGKSGSATLIIDIALILAGAIFVFVAAFLNWYPLSVLVSVVTSFIAWLSIYTDKKTTSATFGFYIIIALTLVYMFMHIYVLLKNHSVDVPFLILTICGMTFDTVLVNILLGTYWCSVMYGKGFEFYLTTRLMKNLIQLPVNIALVYYILGFMRNIKTKLER